MRTLWSMTSPMIPEDTDPPPREVDVLIAGAGLTGLSLALELQASGMSVAIAEARTVGAVTSGHTTGKASLLQGTTLSGIRAHAGDDALRAYVESNLEAQRWLSSRLRRIDGAVETADAVTFSNTVDGDERIDAELDAIAAAGLEVERDVDAASLALPFAPSAALRMRDQLKLHPMRMLGALTAELRAHGTRVVTGCRVQGAAADDTGADVETSRGAIRCRRLVLTTGIPILDRGLFFAKASASRSFVIAYRLPPESTAPRGMFLSADGDGRSLRVDLLDDGGRALVVGGGVHDTGRAGSPGRLRQELDAWAVQRWPGAERLSWWAAQDYLPVSHVPFAGELPRGGGRIYAATGFNKWGMTNAVASALRISGRLLGELPDWDAALSAAHPLRAAGKTIAANAEVGAHLVGGWLSTTLPSTASAPDEGHGEVVRNGMHPVAVSTVEGETRAVSAICPHLGGVLTWNDAECTWDCPLHGSRFNASGALLEGPAVTDLDPAEISEG